MGLGITYDSMIFFYTIIFDYYLLDIPCQGTAAAQQLPKHLRRRAVSHNVNRLPRRLRPRHNAERAKSDNSANGGGQKKPKRPSRKYRRRPSNLLSEYERRQKGAKGGKWLETHIWHAKRYHMVKSSSNLPGDVIHSEDAESTCKAQINGKWGYNLAEYSNDKIFRSCYRGISQKCIMHDTSYLCCVEISGRKNDLKESLSQITPISKYSFFSSSEITNGSREGFAWIYKIDTYPRGVIGKVSFIWKPSNPSLEDKTLWIWIHPSYYTEVWQLFEQLFQLKPVENDETMQSNIQFKDPINEKKLSSKNVPHNKLPLFLSSKYPYSVSIVELRDTLNRFRLLGPLSQAVICDSLKKPTLEYSDNAGELIKTNNNKSWWMSYYNKENHEIAVDQWDYFNNILSSKQPGQMQSNVIVALTVRDPRKTLPHKKKCVDGPNISLLNNINVSPQSAPSNNIANSPLWDATIRDEVSLTKVPDYVINKMRSNMLTPGVSELPLDDDEARVPILLVHQSGDKDSRFGDGWDIIIPAGWGMSYWMNFIYRNVKVVGQKELLNIILETKKFPPLKDAPDSLSGKSHMLEDAEIASRVHFSHPPDKRPNYAKLNSQSPFLQPWNVLIGDWSKNSLDCTKFHINDHSVYVLRDNAQLSQLSLYSQNVCIKKEFNYIETCDEHCLIAVSLEIFGTGTMSANTMISWPSHIDFKVLIDSEGKSINRVEKSKVRPKEPLVICEELEIKRKTLKVEHIGSQKSLRKKCKGMKQKILLIKSSMDVTNPVSSDKNMQLETIKNLSMSLHDLKKLRNDKNEQYNANMRSAWGLDYGEIKDVKATCSRQTLGFVNFSGISLRHGSKSIGLGYVAKSALVQYFEYYKTIIEQFPTLSDIAKDKGVIILLRSPDSQHYSYAFMNIYKH